MKFGKVLAQCEQTLPEMREVFVKYKQLKKKVKAIRSLRQEEEDLRSAKRVKLSAEAGPTSATEQAASRVCATAEKEFVDALNEDVQRCNKFFMEQEENSVIKLQHLQDRLSAAQTLEQFRELEKEFVDLHGHLVLLLHWSLLNYAALAKILKKHDKCTGLGLRDSYLETALKQPFYSTGILSKLVHKAEKKVKVLEKKLKAGSSGDVRQRDTAGSSATQRLQSTTAVASSTEAVLRQTRAAMQTWEALYSNASTPSTFVNANEVLCPRGNLEGSPSSDSSPATESGPLEPARFPPGVGDTGEVSQEDTSTSSSDKSDARAGPRSPGGSPHSSVGAAGSRDSAPDPGS